MYLSYSHTGVEQSSQKKQGTTTTKLVIANGLSPPGSKLVAVVAVGTGGDVHHHRRLVTRTGGDEVADHHCRLVTRAGGVEAHHRRLRAGTDSVALFSFYFPQPAPQISSCPARSNPVRRAPQSPPPSPRPGRRPCAVPRPGIQTRRRPRAPAAAPACAVPRPTGQRSRRSSAARRAGGQSRRPAWGTGAQSTRLSTQRRSRPVLATALSPRRPAAWGCCGQAGGAAVRAGAGRQQQLGQFGLNPLFALAI